MIFDAVAAFVAVLVVFDRRAAYFPARDAERRREASASPAFFQLSFLLFNFKGKMVDALGLEPRTR